MAKVYLAIGQEVAGSSPVGLAIHNKKKIKEVRKLKRLMLILGLCVLLGAVGISASAEAEEECQSGLAVKLGYFMPNDEDVSDIYDSGLTLGADYLFTSSWKSYGFRVGVERFFRARTTRVLGLSIKQKWLVVPVTGTFVYFPAPEKKFYVGGGFGLYAVREKIKMLWISSSTSEVTLGFHLLGGFNFRQFFGEAKISHAVVNSTNVGGLSIFVGYRLRI